MIIGIEGYKMMLNSGAKGRGLRKYIKKLAADNPENNYYIYIPVLPKIREAKEMENNHNIFFRLPPQSGFGGKSWRFFGITNNLEPDKVGKFIGIAGVLPLNIKQSGIETEIIITSLAWRHFPKMFSTLSRKYLDFITSKSCKNASRIKVPSERIKKEISEIYVISPEKIFVEE